MTIEELKKAVHNSNMVTEAKAELIEIINEWDQEENWHSKNINRG